MRRRWKVVCIDADGNEIGSERFWFHRSALKIAAWHERTARGAHPFMTAITDKHGPLFTVEVRRT